MSDNVNHPSHYTGFSNGAEVIDITENLSFNLGNVVKYVARAGRKTDDPIEDLKKAQFYLERELARLTPKAKAWTLDEVWKLRTAEWARRPLNWSIVIGDNEKLPEGLFKSTSSVFIDSAGDEWRWNITHWEYFDPFDEDWVRVVGPPDASYGPFKEKHV